MTAEIINPHQIGIYVPGQPTATLAIGVAFPIVGGIVGYQTSKKNKALGAFVGVLIGILLQITTNAIQSRFMEE